MMQNSINNILLGKCKQFIVLIRYQWERVYKVRRRYAQFTLTMAIIDTRMTICSREDKVTPIRGMFKNSERRS